MKRRSESCAVATAHLHVETGTGGHLGHRGDHAVVTWYLRSCVTRDAVENTQWSSNWGSSHQPQQWCSIRGSCSRIINPNIDTLLIGGLNKLATVDITKVRTSNTQIKWRTLSSDHNLEAGGNTHCFQTNIQTIIESIVRDCYSGEANHGFGGVPYWTERKEIPRHPPQKSG